ncbi:MAG: glycosyltransferase family 9 protein [Phycisphaerae bacterium]
MNNRRTTIGVFHVGALGDCILALHVARAVAGSARFAGRDGPAEVIAIARSPVARLAVGRSVVGAYRDLDAADMSALFAPGNGRNAPGPAAMRAMQDLDGIVSFCGGPDVPPTTRLREITNVSIWAIDPRVRPETVAAGRHITEQWISDLRTIGLDVPPPEPTTLIRLADADCEYGRRRWAGVAGLHRESSTAPEALKKPDGNGAKGISSAASGADCRRVLLHPGSGGRAKCWALDRFEALADRLRANGHMVAWMIGPVEMDWYGESLRERLARTADVIYEEDLVRAASVIAAADVFVGNDSGAVHLAAALGVATVAVFVATAASVWRPIGRAVRTVGGSEGGYGPCSVAVCDVSSAVAEAYARR